MTNSSERADNRLWLWTCEVGAMRLTLALFGLITVALAPAPGTPPETSGWPLVHTMLVPVLAPIILLVILLDVLMARVLMIEKDDAERARYRRVLWFDLAVVLVMLVAWLPYFRAITRTS